MTAPGTLHKRPTPSGYTLAATCACGITHDCATTSPSEAHDRLRDAGWHNVAGRGWACAECVDEIAPKPTRQRGPLTTRAQQQLAALYDGQRAWVEETRTDLDRTALALLKARKLVECEERYGRAWLRISERGVARLGVEVGAR